MPTHVFQTNSCLSLQAANASPPTGTLRVSRRSSSGVAMLPIQLHGLTRSHRNQTMGFGDWSNSICLLRIWLLELVPAGASTCKESVSFREESTPATLRKGTWMGIDMRGFSKMMLTLSHFSNVFLGFVVFDLIKCQSPKWRSSWVSIMYAEARSIAGQLLFVGTSYASLRFLKGSIFQDESVLTKN